MSTAVSRYVDLSYLRLFAEVVSCCRHSLECLQSADGALDNGFCDAGTLYRLDSTTHVSFVRSAGSDRTRKPGVCIHAYGAIMIPRQRRLYSRKSNRGSSSYWRRRQDTDVNMQAQRLAPVAVSSWLMFCEMVEKKRSGAKVPDTGPRRPPPEDRSGFRYIPRIPLTRRTRTPPSSPDNKEHSI